MSKDTTTQISLRSTEMRDLAQTLAHLGARRVDKGEPLNTRRREKVRRAFAEAGDALGWSESTALSDRPAVLASKDVKAIVRRGIRSLRREIDKEIDVKASEAQQIDDAAEKLRAIAEDEKSEYPMEVSFQRTMKSPVHGLVTKTEVFELENETDARRAAKKVENSARRWGRLRDQMIDQLEERREALGALSQDLGLVMDSWRPLLRDVLVTMH